METIISLSDLQFGYGGAERAIFKDLSLQIPTGAITAILGPNGSGKTTLLLLMLGILSPSRGTILLAGRPQKSYSRQEMGQLLGFVSQEEYIPFDLSVLEYALLGRAPYLRPLATPGEIDLQVALESLSQAGLLHLRDRSIQTLSGGERQLTTFARALAQQPRILLLDEFNAHLDLSNLGRVLEIIRALAAQGVTIIFTTHDPGMAAALASFVVLMRQGQILHAGPADAMLVSEKLSATYGVPVEVLHALDRRFIIAS